MEAGYASNVGFPKGKSAFFFVAKMWKDVFRGKAMFGMERWKR